MASSSSSSSIDGDAASALPRGIEPDEGSASSSSSSAAAASASASGSKEGSVALDDGTTEDTGRSTTDASSSSQPEVLDPRTVTDPDFAVNSFDSAQESDDAGEGVGSEGHPRDNSHVSTVLAIGLLALTVSIMTGACVLGLLRRDSILRSFMPAFKRYQPIDGNDDAEHGRGSINISNGSVGGGAMKSGNGKGKSLGGTAGGTSTAGQMGKVTQGNAIAGGGNCLAPSTFPETTMGPGSTANAHSATRYSLPPIFLTRAKN